MEKAREEVLELQPIMISDDTIVEISLANDTWSRIADTLLAQLRSKNLKNADIASGLNEFYLYSMAVMECSNYTFPNTALINKLSKLMPLLPREYRQTITFKDLTEAEIERIGRRIAKRFDWGPEPNPPTRKKRMTV
jgi:hypothetical protein